MIRTKKNILSKCICFVTHGVYYFTTFVISSPVLLRRQDWALHLNWSELCWHDTIDEWYRLLIQFVMFRKYYDKKKLMILDNSGIDYSRMLLFVLGFLAYWKIEPNSHAFSRIRQHVVYDLISERSHLNCQKKQNVTSQTIIFKLLLQ